MDVVKVKDEELWDMYIDGEWIGSKRTIKQVRERAKFLGEVIRRLPCSPSSSDIQKIGQS